jgi:hypothetical protein
VARLLVKTDALRNSVALRLQDAGQRTRFVWAAVAQWVTARPKTQAMVQAKVFGVRSSSILIRPL